MDSCKFCLKTLDNSKHEFLDEKCTGMLKGLLIKLDLNNCNRSFTCDECLEKLKNAYKFKMELVNRETPIFSYVKCEDKEVDSTVIHKNESNDTCTICGKSAINSSALESVEEHQLIQFFKKHIPEVVNNVNMDWMQNPVICESCSLTVHQCLNFFSTISLTEENKKYVIKEEVFDSEQNLLPIFEEKIIKEEFETDPETFKSNFNFPETKKEPDKNDEHTLILFSDVTQTHESLEDRMAIKQDEIHIKSEDSENDSNQALLKKNGYEDVTCTNGKSLDCQSSPFLAIDKTVLDEKIYRCVICSYTTKYKGNLKRHTLIHEHISDVEIYQWLVAMKPNLEAI